jgi:hypothetical protein
MRMVICLQWKNYFPHLLNVDGVSDVRQVWMHTAEHLVPGTRHVEFKIGIANLETCKSLGNDQILAEGEEDGGSEILVSAIYKLINSIWNRENCLISGRYLLLYQFTKRAIKHCNNYRGISLLSTSYNILSNIFLLRLSPYIEEIIEDHQCWFQGYRLSTEDLKISRRWL